MKAKLQGLLFEIAPDIEGSVEDVEEKPKVVQAYNNKKVFIVHGHDHQLLDEVELMLKRIGLEPIIVKNEANAGRTIIEMKEDGLDFDSTKA